MLSLKQRWGLLCARWGFHSVFCFPPMLCRQLVPSLAQYRKKCFPIICRDWNTHTWSNLDGRFLARCRENLVAILQLELTALVAFVEEADLVSSHPELLLPTTAMLIDVDQLSHFDHVGLGFVEDVLRAKKWLRKSKQLLSTNVDRCKVENVEFKDFHKQVVYDSHVDINVLSNVGQPCCRGI